MGILMFINRIKNTIAKDTRALVVTSLALSILNYCFIIWGSCSKTQMNRVQKLQNFAAKVASGKGRKFDRATPFIQEQGWLKMKEKYQHDVCVFMRKILCGKVPEWVVSLSTVGLVRRTVSRQSNDLFVKRTRTDTGKRQSDVIGPLLWNNLPIEVKNEGSANLFKKKVKNHFLTINAT